MTAVMPVASRNLFRRPHLGVCPMLTRLFAARAAGSLLALFAALVTGLVPAHAQQPPTDRPWLFLSTNDKEQGAQNPSNPIWDTTRQSIPLRPNVEQALYLYIRN